MKADTARVYTGAPHTTRSGAPRAMVLYFVLSTDVWKLCTCVFRVMRYSQSQTAETTAKIIVSGSGGVPCCSPSRVSDRHRRLHLGCEPATASLLAPARTPRDGSVRGGRCGTGLARYSVLGIQGELQPVYFAMSAQPYALRLRHRRVGCAADALSHPRNGRRSQLQVRSVGQRGHLRPPLLFCAGAEGSEHWRRGSISRSLPGMEQEV
jgi:hypothetical protein